MDEEPEIQEDIAEQGFQEDQQDYGNYIEEQQEEQQFGNYIGSKPKEGIFTFFNRVIGLKDSSKVANLDKKELGMLDLSVRSCGYLANLGNLLNNKSYKDFFMSKGEVVLATSMSKKGWLPELVVSQKRFSQRSIQPIVPQPPKKGFLSFGKKQPPQQ